MKNRTYTENMTEKEMIDLAYYERNMLALRFAEGWYYDIENNWTGWKRVLCLDNDKMNFHIPDDFNVGNLPQIETKWDGHTTEEKWKRIDNMLAIQ
jgi:hypothetical protein